MIYYYCMHVCEICGQVDGYEDAEMEYINIADNIHDIRRNEK